MQENKLLHGSKVDFEIAVLCKDTDLLILVIWAYSELNITNNWYLKYSELEFTLKLATSFKIPNNSLGQSFIMEIRNRVMQIIQRLKAKSLLILYRLTQTL